MRKKFFNSHLFKEGFKQLKLFGIISLIIYMLSVILIFINEVDGRRIVDIYDCNPLVLLSFTVLAPLFTLFLFSFITSRNSSDFYHSIPYTRTCIFVSFFASIAAWIALIHFSSTVVSVLLRMCFPDSFSIQWAEIIKPCIGIFICSMAVVCGVLFSQSITGTIFTNVLVTGIILFLPRIFTTIFIALINDQVFNIIPTQYYPALLSGSKNMIVYPFLSVFTSGSVWGEIFTTYGEWFYTFVLGVVYFALALTFFKKRKSEVAGNAASSNTLQAIYRISVTMLVCMIPITIICDKTETFSSSDMPMYITIYVIAIVTYFLYEIITTRTVKRLVKIIPGIVIVAVLNVVIIAGVRLISDYELTNIPDSEDVEYVSLMSDDTYAYNNNDYVLPFISEVKITDRKIITSSINFLNVYIDSCKENPNYYVNNAESYPVKIKMKNGSVIYRNIPITETTMRNICNFAIENAQFQKSIDTLPPYSDVTVDISSYYYSNFTSTHYKNVYETMCKEYKALDIEQKLYLQLYNTNYSIFSEEMSSADTLCQIDVYTNNSRFSIPISAEYFPETSTKCLKLFAGSEKEIKKAKKTFERMSDLTLASEGDMFNINIYITGDDVEAKNIYYSAESFNGNIDVVLNSNVANYSVTQNVNEYKFPGDFLPIISSLTPDSFDEFEEQYKKNNSFIIVTANTTMNSYTLFLPDTEDVRNAINNFISSVSKDLSTVE